MNHKTWPHRLSCLQAAFDLMSLFNEICCRPIAIFHVTSLALRPEPFIICGTDDNMECLPHTKLYPAKSVVGMRLLIGTSTACSPSFEPKLASAKVGLQLMSLIGCFMSHCRNHTLGIFFLFSTTPGSSSFPQISLLSMSINCFAPQCIRASGRRRACERGFVE